MDTLKPTGQEVVIKGIAAAPGIAIGPAYLYSKQIPRVQAQAITPADVAGEIERLQNANRPIRKGAAEDPRFRRAEASDPRAQRSSRRRS